MTGATLLAGDVREVLRSLPAESVQCCITSPPYWGLRAYGTEPQVWPDGWRGELGQEPTPALFVEHLVEVFREVRRVLRPDGTLWLNLGDSYASTGRSDRKESPGVGATQAMKAPGREVIWKAGGGSNFSWQLPGGIKPKDLCEIPSDVVRALRADGWWLRSRIPWLKRNAMPESTSDRPTQAVEYVFLLSKSARYFYDGEAAKMAPSGKGGGTSFGKVEQDGPGSRRHGKAERAKYDASRARRNSDWFFESWQGLYTDDDGEPLAFIVNPAAFKGDVSCGTYRIASPDCPVHDYQADLSRVLECDALLPAGQTGGSLDNDGRPVSMQEGAVVAIPVSLNGLLLDESVAIGRSKRRNKTASELERDVIFFGILPAHTEYMERALHSVAMFGRKPANRTAGDSSLGGSHSCPSAQTAARIFCIATFQPSLFVSGCQCHYTGKVEKRQDHFAVFPPGLVEPCIKVGTSEKGCCPTCGKPWERVVEKARHFESGSGKSGNRIEGKQPAVQGAGYGDVRMGPTIDSRTLGWRPGCRCHLEGDGVETYAPIPCTVMDPFSGAGTTALVAVQQGRRAIGIELNAGYNRMAERRIAKALRPATSVDETAKSDLPLLTEAT